MLPINVTGSYNYFGLCITNHLVVSGYNVTTKSLQKILLANGSLESGKEQEKRTKKTEGSLQRLLCACRVVPREKNY